MLAPTTVPPGVALVRASIDAPRHVQVASTVVNILNRFYPQHMDRLEREKTFFPGPGPLLMSSLTLDDFAILLSGSNRKASQVKPYITYTNAALKFDASLYREQA